MPSDGIIRHMPRDNIREGIGESEVYLDFMEAVSRIAGIDRPVIFCGERGSGKELAARRLHFLSKRWQGPLVTVNLASLPESLIESELFGYESGAFTGAKGTRKGRFEEAEGGTLFLDEIALVPLSVQEKILRTVEYGTYERIGSSETRHTDVRIIAATNADLKKMAEEGRFKEDLLDRLSFEVLFLPPLRERGDDIMLLANHFAAAMATECGKSDVPYFSQEAEEKLMRYPWPGNIRELKNTVERAVCRTRGAEIRDIEFDPFRSPYRPLPGRKSSDPALRPLSDYPHIHDDIDVAFLKRALEEGGGSQKRAAELLGITYDQFRGIYRRLRSCLQS